MRLEIFLTTLIILFSLNSMEKKKSTNLTTSKPNPIEQITKKLAGYIYHQVLLPNDIIDESQISKYSKIRIETTNTTFSNPEKSLFYSFVTSNYVNSLSETIRVGDFNKMYVGEDEKTSAIDQALNECLLPPDKSPYSSINIYHYLDRLYLFLNSASIDCSLLKTIKNNRTFDIHKVTAINNDRTDAIKKLLISNIKQYFNVLFLTENKCSSSIRISNTANIRRSNHHQSTTNKINTSNTTAISSTSDYSAPSTDFLSDNQNSIINLLITQKCIDIENIEKAKTKIPQIASMTISPDDSSFSTFTRDSYSKQLQNALGTSPSISSGTLEAAFPDLIPKVMIDSRLSTITSIIEFCADQKINICAERIKAIRKMISQQMKTSIVMLVLLSHKEDHKK